VTTIISGTVCHL